MFPAEATKPIEMSENNIMDETLDNLKIDDIDTLSAESERLLIENTELRKLMGLMQENVELRGTLKNHEMKIRSLSPPRKPKNNAKGKLGLLWWFDPNKSEVPIIPLLSLLRQSGFNVMLPL